MIESLPVALLAAALGLAFFAGIVKGVTGFAMPMILISGLGSFLTPEQALAGLVLPTLVANIWQAVRQGGAAALASARQHWRFVAILLLALLISAQFVTRLPGTLLYLILGVPVTIFALLQLAGWRPKIDPANRRAAELGVGAFSGAIGGLSGVWGPPTVMYLTAMNVPKQEHVRVQGVIYATGAVVFTLAHVKSGVLDWDGLAFSALLLPPAVLGMILGLAVHDRLDQKRFSWAILIVLTIAGLNLVRRGLAG